MRRRFILWLGILLGIVAVGEGLAFLLGAQGMAGGSMLVQDVAAVAAVLWLILTPTWWFDLGWDHAVTLVLGGTLLASLIAWLCYSLGSTSGMIAVAGIYGMGMAFYLGMLLIRLVLLPGTPVMGVARTLVNEAMRMKVPLVFMAALVLIVPILPFTMDPTERLQYRIQSFLSWSMLAVFMLLSLKTIFLAVGTISSEIDRRHIYLTLTKPVSRLQYLAGKWLGIVLLDLVLVVVAGAGIYTFTEILSQQQARSGEDAYAVKHEVLVARQAVSPRPTNPKVLQQFFKENLASARRQDPETYGQPGSSQSSLSASARHTIEQRSIRQWYSLGAGNGHSYVFKGLGHVTSPTVQLQIKPESGKSATFVYLVVRINGRFYHLSSTEPLLLAGGEPIKLVAGDYHILNIPTSAINDKGNLEIDIGNPRMGHSPEGQGTIDFNPKDGIELLYQVGGFEGNLARSLVVLWIRLAFLAMLGLTAGTFLGFPTASLLCVLVYVTASGSVYLHSSIKSFAAFPVTSSPTSAIVIFFHSLFSNLLSGRIEATLKIVIVGISSAFLRCVPAFGSYSPTPLLTDGRLVGWDMVGQSLLWVGLIWTGVTAGIGYVVFRLRELARVTV